MKTTAKEQEDIALFLVTYHHQPELIERFFADWRDQETTIAALRRCEESLREECASLKHIDVQAHAYIIDLEQTVATLRAELTSARIALRRSASRTYDSATKLFEPNAAASWLDAHPDKNG